MSERFVRLKRSLLAMRTAWSILGISLVLIVCVEGGLRLFFRLRDANAPAPFSDPRLLSEGYGNAPWVGEVFDETARVESTWSPFVYFHQKPVQGKYVHIDPNGIRATWTPPPRP